ncbi:MAG: TnsA endonuclease N-terminal domain-containing protein [Candidatus Eremiobacteraeota bacterium]|nr:TnsA endonuclease N-terminal domain-containing protein [Candidatus Eremiobacteraeota bacterium]
MGVRRIRPNPWSTTGFIASDKNGGLTAHESGLERDFAILLEFDPRVESFEAQPLRITYRSSSGRPTSGVPDYLVTFVASQSCPRELVDVKYRSEVFQSWTTLKPRLKAALRHARDNGWTYRIKTETEIRTPYLMAARFLLPFRRLAPDPIALEAIQSVLKSAGKSTPERILQQIAEDRWRRAELLPTLWNLIATFAVRVNFDEPLTMGSVVSARAPNAS